MNKAPFTAHKLLRSLSLLTACTVVLLASSLRGQDDNSAPPPPDNTAPAPDASDANAPDDSASFQTFYDSLGSQGTWIQSSDYGYVWQPPVNDPSWAPYTDGYWVYTDDGWTWVSNESWGWATYHYGRWVNLDGTGWCWVPGYTWAPAWVSWRYGDGYCGWAPLPPDSFVGVDYFGDGSDIGIGFHIGGDCDGFYGIGAGCYTFLPVNCLGYRNYHGYYHNRADNFAIINRTTNVTNLNVTRNGAGAAGASGFQHVTTGGPSLDQVNAVSQTPVPRVSLVRTNQPGGGGKLTGDSVSFYAPHVQAGASSQPSHVSGFIRQATINRGTDVTQPLAVNSHLTPSAATETQVQQARLAQSQAPVSAKVVTDSSTVQPLLRTPLTSLKPAVTQSQSTSTFNSQRTPAAAGFGQEERTYPSTGEQGNGQPHFYSPSPTYPSGPPSSTTHPSTSATEGGNESHSFVRPSSSAPSSSGSSGSHQSSGGSSGSGGGSHSGGSSGGSHPGANSSQSH
jgi:uncharacterized membrane protein YgcG